MPVTVIELANEVQDELAKLVAPATPDSIRASSFSWRRNTTLFGISAAAIGFFGVFAVPTLFPNSTQGELANLFRIVGGAGLGSSFYALNTANDYVKNSTFDPKYNQTYIVRFGMGILSGIILAYFFKDLQIFGGAGGGANSSAPPGLKDVGAGALALIGGYAAEAVTRVLDRVSDTFVALISGSDRDKIEAAKTKAQADAERKTKASTGEAVRKLQKAVDSPDPKTAVQQVIGQMLT